MKKHILLGLGLALALFATTSCNEDLLNIPQKGVIAYENFYQTDEDAESAIVSVYHELVGLYGKLNGNTPSYNVFFNAPGDELYWGGSNKDDHTAAQEINEFRATYTSTNGHITSMYKKFYAIIYKANLVIDNFGGELADSQVKKRCVAEARVIRAWCHMQLACYFGTPPLVDHVLPGDARPTNSDKEELWKWIIDEFKASVDDLPARSGKTDKKGAVKITKGAAQAFLGKALVLHGDYAAAKEPLKAVISSGNYALVPGSKMADLFHMAGDANEEKVFELNVVDNDTYGSNGRWDYQANQSLFFRQLSYFPDFTLQSVGWGNNMAPTKKFVDALLANEAGSYRQKAWIVSYEDFLTEFPYSKLDTKSDGSTMTKEEKLMDKKRGLDLKKRPDLYANCGWFFLKFVPRAADLNNNSTARTQENKIVMRYAEVLLLYAEACAQTGDNDGLKYLNMVAERADAPTYSSLTMENVKKEKWFEMAWEGTRFVDLVRWGDVEKELAFRSHSLTPYLRDDFFGNWEKKADGSADKSKPLTPVAVSDGPYTYYTFQGITRDNIAGSYNEATGRPHKAIVMWADDGYGAKGGGFVKGKHELYPFPFDVIELNPWNEEKGEGLKQNPGWD
ncbi:MAG: RagB/SusD family nutrient uptake outer membrane protein [Bacteroidales bacterium]|nr:RagB/SusD family nutrient uptake outer membrane protein [Bacteroidales bacterium]